MIRIVRIVVGLALSLMLPALALAAPLGDCSSETSLAGRSDVVFCEPWEKTDWWTKGYVGDGTKAKAVPVVAADVDHT